MNNSLQPNYSNFVGIFLSLIVSLRFLWFPGLLLLVALVTLTVVQFSAFALVEVASTAFFVPGVLVITYSALAVIWTFFPFSNLNRLAAIAIRVFGLVLASLAIFILSSYGDYREGTLGALRLFLFDSIDVSITYVIWIFALVAIYLNARFLDGWNSDVVYETIRLEEIDYIKAEILPKISDAAGSVVLSFSREAIRLKKLAFTALYGVGIIVFLAVLAVIFAGALTVSDQRATSAISQAQQSELSAERRLRDLLKELAELPNEESRLEASKEAFELTMKNLTFEPKLPSPNTPPANQSDNDSDFPTANDFASQLAESARDGLLERTFKEYSDTSAKINLLSQRKEDLPNDIQNARAQLEIASQLTNEIRRRVLMQMTDEGATNNSNSLIASAVTRFGLIIVLTFFAQALINLYRYSMRLSSFYWSKALLVTIADGKPDVMLQLSEVFSPLRVSLGKEPKTPVDEAVKLMNAAKPTS